MRRNSVLDELKSTVGQQDAMTITKSSPCDSPESLVSNEVIWCRWVRSFTSNEGIK